MRRSAILTLSMSFDIGNIVDLSKVPKLKDEARSLRNQAEALLSRAAEIDRFVEVIETLQKPVPAQREELPGVAPGPAARPSSQPMKGIPAIRKVMREELDRIWTAREIFDVMRKRGWVSTTARNPFHGVQSGLARMAEHGEVERVDYGQYRYAGLGRDDQRANEAEPGAVGPEARSQEVLAPLPVQQTPWHTERA